MSAFRRLLAGVMTLLSVTIFAAFLGRIKTLYFLKTFGVSPESLEVRWSESLFASWYVVQNLFFFALVLWLAVRTARWSSALFAMVYALIPLATHYAYLGYANPVVRWCVDHQHTLLKFLPFLALAFAWFAWPEERRPILSAPRRPRAPAAALFLLLVASWGLSAAKHFGSYDAERILRRPAASLPSIELEWRADESSPLPAATARQWLLHMDEKQLVVLVLDAVEPWARPAFSVQLIERDRVERISLTPPGAIQPGGQFL